MLSHYELMRGLAMISEIRQVRYLDLLGEQRSKGRDRRRGAARSQAGDPRGIGDKAQGARVL